MAPIRTERLILRQWRKSDFAPFAKMNADSRVREFFPSLLSKEESDESAQFIRDTIEELGWGLWAAEVPGVSDFVGFIGIAPVTFEAHFTPAVEIGWRLHHDYWGKGYATEGAKASLEYGFKQLGLKEIVAFTAVNNQRSRNVMEKIGMTHNPKDDFNHPRLPKSHPIARQVLYRIRSK